MSWLQQENLLILISKTARVFDKRSKNSHYKLYYTKLLSRKSLQEFYTFSLHWPQKSWPFYRLYYSYLSEEKSFNSTVLAWNFLCVYRRKVISLPHKKTFNETGKVITDGIFPYKEIFALYVTLYDIASSSWLKSINSQRVAWLSEGHLCK